MKALLAALIATAAGTAFAQDAQCPDLRGTWRCPDPAGQAFTVQITQQRTAQGQRYEFVQSGRPARRVTLVADGVRRAAPGTDGGQSAAACADGFLVERMYRRGAAEPWAELRTRIEDGHYRVMLGGDTQLHCPRAAARPRAR